MVGDPAGLANADEILEVSLFRTLYGQSPVVFGSFPSLHGGWPLMMCLFVPGRTLKVIFALYVVWVSWAAMYLNHHYLIDLIGIAFYVLISYFGGKSILHILASSKIRNCIYLRLHHQTELDELGDPSELLIMHEFTPKVKE